MLELVARHLRTMNAPKLEVIQASDGEEAWDALHCGHYDMLITDNEMPRLSGIKLVERVRDSGMSLPIIMATPKRLKTRPAFDMGSAFPFPMKSSSMSFLIHVPIETSNDI